MKAQFSFDMRNRYPHRSLACAVVGRAVEDARRGTLEDSHDVRWWADAAQGVPPNIADSLSNHSQTTP